MKIEMILGNRNNKEKLEKFAIELESIAYETIREPESYLNIFYYRTNSKNIKDCFSEENGKCLYVNLNSPYLRDVSKFYQNVLEFSREQKIDLGILDSKVSYTKDKLGDFTFFR